jgi:hypothetical protein
LHAGFCAFTWRKFTLFDYGVYTNMIWNSGHGAPFRCLVDRSYLATHLSFTLALLGPLFRIWDHPFLLWTAQWLFLVSGTALLAAAAVRLRVPTVQAAAVAVFFAGYHYTQQVLLSEFHGVSLYLLLIPWLYHCLRFNRPMAWLPWLLVLGLREDSALLVLPMLLYFAVRERWRVGYVYAALSIGYMVLATTTLFPLLTGMSLLQRRHANLAGSALAHTPDAHCLRVRLKALFWVVLPALPFVRKGAWVPLVTFPLLALIQALGGGTERQFSLSLHYSAPVMACLAVALVESLACQTGSHAADPPTRSRPPWAVAIGLLLITIASHRAYGLLPGGRHRHAAGMGYVQPHETGLMALRAAGHLPREGVLVCPPTLAGFCANRRDVIDWRHYDPKRHRLDLVFTEAKYLDHEGMGFRGILEDGSFGMTFFDGTHIILQRGADPSPNRLVAEAFQRAGSGAPFARTSLPPTRGVSLTSVSIPALHWKGSQEGESAPMPAAHPSSLAAGDYDAIFVFTARLPEGAENVSWGTLHVRRNDTQDVLAGAEIEPVGAGPRSFRSQRVTFSLGTPTQVRATVTGRGAELWLQRVDFVKRGQEWSL